MWRKVITHKSAFVSNDFVNAAYNCDRDVVGKPLECV